MSLFKKELDAIRLIRKAEALALRMSERGFHVAFSGGKDSQVLLALMEMSGCKFHAEMQVTTVDSPNLMKFVRKNYPQVHLNLPEENMRKLILRKKMLPLRGQRYCCAVLKEQAGAGTVTCLGVRAAESTKRATRKQIELIGKKGVAFDIEGDKIIKAKDQNHYLFEMEHETEIFCVGGKDKVIISPIFNWSDKDVWDFIKENNLPYCDLYDMGFHRIGCLFCPMASVKEKSKELEMFPRIAEKVYLRAIRELMEQGYYDKFETPEQVFNWWISNDGADEWICDHTSPELF